MMVSMRILTLVFVLLRITVTLAFSQDLCKLQPSSSKWHSVKTGGLDEKSIQGDYDDGLNSSPRRRNNDDRRRFLMDITRFCSLACMTTFPVATHAKSYSENARNLERINAGDFSGGAVYSNNPPTEAGKKRRAMTGCKTPLARQVASEVSLNGKKISEMECNSMVMSGDTEFMLKALRNLDCPTCPYGIASNR